LCRVSAANCKIIGLFPSLSRREESDDLGAALERLTEFALASGALLAPGDQPKPVAPPSRTSGWALT
jgi:hypothetical protein